MKHFDGGHRFTDGAMINLLVVFGIFVAVLLRMDLIVDFIGRWM